MRSDWSRSSLSIRTSGPDGTGWGVECGRARRASLIVTSFLREDTVKADGASLPNKLDTPAPMWAVI